MARTETPQELPRRLSGWSLAAITVGIIIGSGIFRSPSTVAGLVGTPAAVMGVWLAGGVVTVCLALSLAELAAMFPKSGGLYTYLEEAFGRRTAFLFGWTFLLINPANWAAVGLIFAEYLVSVAHVGEGQARLIATAAIVIVSAINIVSLRWATRFNWLFTAVKGGALLALSLGILLFHHGGGAATAASPHHFTLGGWGAAFIAVLWPFEGVAAAAAMAGEVKSPRRGLPLGLVGGTLFVTAVYLLVNAALLSALPMDRLASSPFVAADAAVAAFGAVGGSLVAACALVATFGALLAGATCDPRVLFALAEDGLFFRSVGKVSARWRTPYVAIAVSCVLAIVYVWVRTFEELAAQFVIGMWIFYALCVVGLIKLRITRPNEPRPFRTPFYPTLPVVFVAAAGALLVNALLEMPVVTLIDLGLVALGLPAYALWIRVRPNRQHSDRTNGGHLGE